MDGEFGSAIYHTECREAEIAFNSMCGGTTYEWCSLRDDRDIPDDDWLLAEFPLVAQRLGVKQNTAAIPASGEGEAHHPGSASPDRRE